MYPEVNRILEFFLKNPTTSIHLREIARQTGFSPAGARKALQKLKKEGWVTENKTTAISIYKANTAHLHWTSFKRVFNQTRVYDSNLLQSLKEAYQEPEAIVLFGSFARGEDTEKSDIDIAVITSQDQEFDPTPYQRKLGKTINLTHVNLKTAKKEFLNSLANGIVLHGYLNLP